MPRPKTNNWYCLFPEVTEAEKESIRAQYAHPAHAGTLREYENIWHDYRVKFCDVCDGDIRPHAEYYTRLDDYAGKYECCSLACYFRAARREKTSHHINDTAHCGHCFEPFKRARSTQKYCSPKCRVAAHRAKT